MKQILVLLIAFLLLASVQAKRNNLSRRVKNFGGVVVCSRFGLKKSCYGNSACGWCGATGK
jgi:hypothetical protein